MGDYGDSTDTAYDGALSSFKSHFSAKVSHSELQILEIVRGLHRDKHVTPVQTGFANIKDFAKAGHAQATLIRDGDEFMTQRRYTPPGSRMEGGDGELSEKVSFGLFEVTYDQEKLLMYAIEYPTNCGTASWQYLLTPRDSVVDSGSPLADKLIKAAGKWSSELHEEVYVFDSGRWIKSHQLWEAVQSASWDDVILEPAMKDTLITDVEGFFDSRAVYEEYSVPWKRGIILHGTPGCGKTISIKALMNSLQKRDVASLYVKSFEAEQGLQYSIRYIFQQARIMAPCLLIFEDLDSLVVDKVRSYFLNEVDGLEDNDGILMIGSTNHLDRLDPGIAKRPSRFDRKYHYKLPAEKERIQYCKYWRGKLQKNNKIQFDDEVCEIVAQLTEGFSFAYLKELFVQTLLTIVGGRADDADEDEDDLTVAADETHIAEGSGSLLKEGETLETSPEDSTTQASTEEKKPERKMPEIDIPEHLLANPLMRILRKQSKALWKEMDNSTDEIHGRAKVGDGVSNRRAARKFKVMQARPVHVQR